MILFAAVDFDGAVKLFNMDVTVTDTSSNSVIIPVVIEIKPANEFAPVFPADITVNFNEDTAVGSDIATPVATDGDSNDTPDGVLTYSIQSGSWNFLLRRRLQVERFFYSIQSGS
ncbi:hypothetical protein DPMN_004359 [Dreissena polymorpha]|uniref:Cadherin domain-containing protein n=1 Tax=Dreissena polymorpha TaxID=45954 RepID=A0A9D4MNC4_DREPO|nr:hypothetical protein DPMN_004359 [Dreissena polymorpha]